MRLDARCWLTAEKAAVAVAVPIVKSPVVGVEGEGRGTCESNCESTHSDAVTSPKEFGLALIAD